MEKNEKDILEELGWKNMDGVPVANEANKQLQTKLTERMAKLGEKRDKLQLLRSRLALMEKYRNTLKTQLNKDNQSVLHVQRAQIGTAKDNLGALDADLARQRNQLKEIRGQLEFTCTENEKKKMLVVRELSKVSSVRDQLETQKEIGREMNELHEKLAADQTLLERFELEDRKRIKDLQLKREQTNTEYLERKKEMEKLLNEMRSLELNRKKTTKMYAQTMKEHEILIGRWNSAIKQLHELDREIFKVTTQMSSEMDRLGMVKEQKTIQSKSLEEKQQANLKLEAQVRVERSKYSNMRKNFIKISNRLRKLNTQIENSTSELNRSVQLKDQERGKLQSIEQMCEKQKIKIDFVKKQTQALVERIEEIRMKIVDENAIVDSLNRELVAEQQLKDRYVREIEQSQNGRYQNQTVLDGLEKHEMLVKAKIDGCAAYMNSLQEQLRKSNKNVNYLQGIQYGLELKINSVQKKLARLSDMDSSDRNEETKATIASLQASLESKNKILVLLQTQRNSLEEEIRLMNAQVEKDEPKTIKLTEELRNDQIVWENSRRQLRAKRMHFEQCQVDENLVRLKATELDERVGHLANEIREIKELELERNAYWKEQILTATGRKDVLQMKKNLKMAELHKKQIELNELGVKTNLLMNKYDVVLKTVGTNQDGEPHTITYVRLQRAQEKMELRDQERQLRKEVTEIEKEIAAMNNTLAVMNLSNDSCRKETKAMAVTDENTRTLKQLQNSKLELEKELVKKQKELRDKMELIERLENEKDTKLAEMLQIESQIFNWKIQIAHCDKEIGRQQEKLTRIEFRLKNVTGKCNEKCSASEVLQDVRFRIRIVQQERALRIVRDLIKRLPQEAQNRLRNALIIDSVAASPSRLSNATAAVLSRSVTSATPSSLSSSSSSFLSSSCSHNTQNSLNKAALTSTSANIISPGLIQF